MKSRLLMSIAALCVGALALTACGSDDTTDSSEQDHIEHLQDLDEAAQMRAAGEPYESPEPDETADAAAPERPESNHVTYDDPQEWADARAGQYRTNFAITYTDVCGEQVETLGGCGTLDPHSSITEIAAPEIGELVVQVEDGPWQTGWAAEWPAEYVAGGMMHFIAFDALDVEQITVELPDGTSYTEHWNPMMYESNYGQQVIPATIN